MPTPSSFARPLPVGLKSSESPATDGATFAQARSWTLPRSESVKSYLPVLVNEYGYDLALTDEEREVNWPCLAVHVNTRTHQIERRGQVRIA